MLKRIMLISVSLFFIAVSCPALDTSRPANLYVFSVAVSSTAVTKALTNDFRRYRTILTNNHTGYSVYFSTFNAAITSPYWAPVSTDTVLELFYRGDLYMKAGNGSAASVFYGFEERE